MYTSTILAQGTKSNVVMGNKDLQIKKKQIIIIKIRSCPALTSIGLLVAAVAGLAN